MSNAMRVMNVVADERFGGPQSRILQVASRLKAKNVETIVVTRRGDRTFAMRLAEAGVPCVEIDLVRPRASLDPRLHLQFFRLFSKNVREMRKIIRERAIHVVHTNGLIGVQAAIAARLEGAPLVWHLNDVTFPRPLRMLLLPLVRRWATVIAVSAHRVGEFYLGAWDAAPDLASRVHVLHAPVDIHRFVPGIDGSGVRRELKIALDCPVIGAVGNLSPGKGFEFLLRAMPEILRSFPETRCLIAGAPLANRQAYRDQLERAVESLGLQGRVFFLGRRDDMPQVIAALNVYVHPSEFEACPMAVLEASASGRAVVATNAGGTVELVENGSTGILVAPRHAGQIAQAVIRLLADPATAKRMGEAGREWVQERFSLESCWRRHLSIYEAASRARRGPAQFAEDGRFTPANL